MVYAEAFRLGGDNALQVWRSKTAPLLVVKKLSITALSFAPPLLLHEPLATMPTEIMNLVLGHNCPVTVRAVTRRRVTGRSPRPMR
jgi:hypothetical protein